MKPLLVYDGDCDFCRFWADRWRARTAHRVDYSPFQISASEYPEIPKREFARAVVLVEAKGAWRSGAGAICRLWSFRSRTGVLVWWCYQRIPFVAAIAEFAYRHIASHRGFYWKVTRMIFRIPAQ